MNCPDCDASSVSVEVGPSGTGRLIHLVVRAGEAEAVEVVRSCWTCGWRETRDVSVEAIRVDPGDRQIVAREQLRNELIEATSSLDQVELEAALTAVNECSGRDG